MTAKTARQFGLFESPLSPGSLAEDKRLDAVRWDSDGRTLVWLEGRSGKGVLVVEANGLDAPRDLTAELDVRAEVGYGGGDFTVADDQAYFVVHKSGRIFRQSLLGGSARPITPAFGQASSPVVSPDGRFVAYVHHDGVEDRLAIVGADGSQWPQILAAGRDFYMQPRWSPDGRHLAWIAWDHPNMPWDGTNLCLAPVIANEGHLPRLGPTQVVAGGSDVSIFQPEFTPDGQHLLYISDEPGWWHLAARNLKSGETRWLTSDEAEYGAPAWMQDQRTYAVSHDGRFVLATRNRRGLHDLVRIELASGTSTPVTGLGAYGDIAQVTASPREDRVAFVASGPAQPPRVVECEYLTGKSRIVARSSGEAVPAAALSKCEAISWPTAGGETAHGLYYPPASERFEGIGKPPLILLIHGGPTSQARASWPAGAQFFATRGYGVLFVNYRGSTGYGRQYMLKLRSNWGICDVEDAISGAKFLAEAGRIDPARTVIMGGSAGGFTVLQAMVDHPEAFTAGVCLYGVADQFHLASQTHKFESRYTDTLLGPLPEAAAIYRARSPVFHAAKISRPLAVYQGAIDRVVPQAQSDMIVEALKRNGTPHIYHVYEGEGHGWRKRETIEHYYKAVDEFLRKWVLLS
ncbi:MAG: S9 family peptidase [Planctomycetales bacterium]|nr:S9 family peptidase [Planctomycetales bacterium]